MSDPTGGFPPPTQPPVTYSQPAMPPPQPPARPWWKRPVALWLVIVIGLVALFLGVATGGSAKSDADKAKAAEKSALSERDSAAKDRDAARSSGDALSSSLDAASSTAANALDSARSEASSEFAASSSALNDAKAQQDTRQAAIDASAASVAAASEGLKADTFSDGIFEVGRDIQPGKYHTDGTGSSCYYAKLRSSDTSDIDDNNNVTGPVTITIDSAYFESARCGTWTKVG